MKLAVPILLYHSVSTDAPRRFRDWVLTPQIFAEHMAYLHGNGYSPITVSQFVSGSLPERPVLITFDDGFADFYTHALPILNEHGFTATMYIPTGLVGASGHWLNQLSGKSLMSWDQIIEIDWAGIECGSHSVTHPQLDTLTHAAARSEITDSKHMLEDRLGHEVASFAYPNGYHSASVRELVRSAGYSSAVAVKHAMSALDDDCYTLSRIMLRSSDNAMNFAEFVQGKGLRVAPRGERLLTKGWRMARRLSARTYSGSSTAD